jgi:hypothetical protein
MNSLASPHTFWQDVGMLIGAAFIAGFFWEWGSSFAKLVETWLSHLGK